MSISRSIYIIYATVQLSLLITPLLAQGTQGLSPLSNVLGGLQQNAQTNSQMNNMNSIQYLNQQMSNQQNSNNILRQNSINEAINSGKSGPSTSGATQKNLKGIYNVDLENLTDSEKLLSEKFVHLGLSKRIREEECEKLENGDSACRGNRAKTKFMGMDSGMVQYVAKAYTMVMGASMLSGGMGKLNLRKGVIEKAEAANKVSKTSDAEIKKTRNDYCPAAAMAAEGIATFQQATFQNNLNNLPTNQSTAQKEQLYKAGRSHEERSKNSRISAIGFSGTTACYAGMISLGGAAIDLKTGLKMGASGFLSMFYWNEVKAHQEYADNIKAIADKLPGKGDCNPITENNCYCSQPETKNDPVYCLPPEFQKRAKSASVGDYTFSCVSNTLQTDPSCACKITNTCLDQKISTGFDELPNMGNAFAGQIFNPLKSITRGSLPKASLAGGSLSQASNRKRLRTLANKLGPINRNLNKSQQREKSVLEKFGVPSNLATLMASQPLSKSAMDNLAKFQGASSRLPSNSKYKGAVRSKILTFDQGGRSRRRSRRGGDGLGNLLNRFKKKKSRRNSDKILKFAEKAQRRAQISQSSGDIFKIISRRYIISGRKNLGID